MTSLEQVGRLLALVPYLQARPGIRLTEVAATFGVTEQQLMQDLQVIWMCGLPGGLPDDLIEIDMEAVEGEGVVHLSNADYLSRPLRFTPDEAVSLVVALNAIGETATGSLAAAARSAAAKLTEITGQVDPVWLSINTGDADLRALLQGAVEQRRRLRLTYDGAARGETTTPVVDPVGIELRDSIAYLQAWSLDRDAWRTYRLERIVAASETGDQADDHGPPPQVPPGWFDADAPRVSLDLAPEARWVSEYYPVLGVEPGPAGRLRAVFAVADPGWVTGLLLRLGSAVSVVEPSRASTAARAAAAEALELYDRFAAPTAG